jgi:archaellum biogenesis protein FlaJ (TadC family)
VEQSLADRRPSRLREQRPRRLLVVIVALVIAALALTIFIAQVKFRTYAEFALMVTGLVLYFQLRKAVRLVVDAPNELLDERQIALRDSAYTVAYRTLVALSVAYGVIVSAVTPHGVLHPHVGEGFWTGLAWSYLLCASSLPAMVLAWRMPSEPVDDAA